MKRQITALSGYLVGVVLILLLAGLTACSSSNASPSIVSTSTAVSTQATGSTGQTVNLTLTAVNMAFDQSTINIPAGASVVMKLVNQDRVPHNFAMYTDSSAAKAIFVGENITNSTITYKFTVPPTPGKYFFRCDVHPNTMVGTVVVQ
jgi:plastocyanin